MAKINPFKNRRLRGITESRTFKDLAQPGVEVSVTLASQPGSATQLTIEGNASNMAERFVLDTLAEGIWLEGTELKVTLPLCYCIATIQTLDAGAKDDRYTFEEWVAISYTMPTAFDDIVKWAGALLGAYEELENPDGSTPLPNDSAEGSGQLSGPPPSSNLPVILK